MPTSFDLGLGRGGALRRAPAIHSGTICRGWWNDYVRMFPHASFAISLAPQSVRFSLSCWTACCIMTLQGVCVCVQRLLWRYASCFPILLFFPLWSVLHAAMQKYQVAKQLGDGSYGCVYLAKNTESGEVVAIKKWVPKLVQSHKSLVHTWVHTHVLHCSV